MRGLVFATLLAIPWAAPCDAETLSRHPGERYFRIGGEPMFVLGRNATGWAVEQFGDQFAAAESSGERLVRLHLGVGMPPHAAPGALDTEWAARWEAVFSQARAHGLSVLPVSGVWSEWNDGSAGEAWHQWHANPYNAANGGPARLPSELLLDTPCRQAWLAWLGGLVERWAPRPEIAGWETFSEIDLISGADEASGTAFAEAAADAVRAHDPAARPVTASLAGTNEWPALFASRGVDLVQVHPYANQAPYAGDLAGLILQCVPARLARYGKPVLIGESGLDARPPRGTLVEAPSAVEGIRQALWAAAVSGACVGRMLWWEDGYDRYEGVDLSGRYRDASLPVSRFVTGIGFGDMKPAEAAVSPAIEAAALAGGSATLVWARDRACRPPEWPRPTVSGAWVEAPAPCVSGECEVEFWDTAKGEATALLTATARDGRLTVALPAFEGSVALRIVPAPG